MKSKYTLADYAFQFITVTVGMFIALFINGLVEWNRNRELVAEARVMIAREIADNNKDLDATVSSFPRDQAALLNAIKFADEMLSAHKTAITSLELHYNLADLSDTSWRTAERTGALSQMDYGEVQRYSKLYDFQELFLVRQREAVALLANASSLISGNFDPDKPNPKDLEIFRQRVMELRAALNIQEGFAKKLAENYAEALKK
jgi:hypothetical protein